MKKLFAITMLILFYIAGYSQAIDPLDSTQLEREGGNRYLFERINAHFLQTNRNTTGINIVEDTLSRRLNRLNYVTGEVEELKDSIPVLRGLSETNEINISKLNDSITVHRSFITALLDSVFRGGDTTTVTDNTPPEVVSAKIANETPFMSEIIFDEYIEYLNSDSVIYNISYRTKQENGTPITIDSCNYNADTLFLYHDSLTHSDYPYLVYFTVKESGLQDTAGNVIQFASVLFANNIEDSTSVNNSLLHWWGFNANMEDPFGDADGTSTSMNYTASAREGGFSFDKRYATGSTPVQAAGVTFPDSGSIYFSVYPTEETASSMNIIFGNNAGNTTPGIQCWMGAYGSGDNSILVYTSNGSTRSDAKTGAGALSMNTWNNVHIVYNFDSLYIYVNKGLKSTHFSINPNFDKDNTLYIGDNANSSGGFFGFIDNFGISTKVMREADIAAFDYTATPKTGDDPDEPGDKKTGYVSLIDTSKYNVIWGFEPNKVPVSDTGQQYWTTGNNFSKYFPQEGVIGGVQGFPDYSSPPAEHHPYPTYFQLDADRTNVNAYNYVARCYCRGDSATTGRVYIRGYGTGDDYYQVLRQEVDSGYHGGPFWSAYIPGNHRYLWKEIIFRVKPGFNAVLGGKLSKYHSSTVEHNYDDLLDGFRVNISMNHDSSEHDNNYEYQYIGGGLKHYYSSVGFGGGYGRAFTYNDTIGGTDPANVWRYPKDGSWIRITHAIYIGNNSAFDSKIYVWLNGKFSHIMQTYGDKKVEFASTNNTFIDQAVFWFYFGGNSGEHAPKRDEYMEILRDIYYLPKPSSGIPELPTELEVGPGGRHTTLPILDKVE